MTKCYLEVRSTVNYAMAINQLMVKMSERSSSLIRGLDILTVIAGRPDGVAIPEIVEALGAPRSNVVRIVNTLIEYGLVSRAERRIRPTQALFDLCRPDRHDGLRRRYRPVLEHLSKKLNELVLLGLQEGDAIVHIDYIESDQRVRVAPSPVTRHDLHHNAIGKIALARRPDLLSQIDDPALLEELARVRRTGIAWNREETTEGVIVIACPGFTNMPTEPIIAIAWPINRFSDEKATSTAALVRETLRLAAGPRA